VDGALDIQHDEVAPYSLGFEVTFRSTEQKTCQWICYSLLPEVAEQVTRQIERGTPQIDTPVLLTAIAFAEKNKITAFTLEHNLGPKPFSNCTSRLVSAWDVHRGVAWDGIILGHFQGKYGNIATKTQNDTVRALVALKDFCLDCVHKLPSCPLVEFVIGYLKDHGTDISTPEKLNAWIRENPDKCALPENRARTPVRPEAKSGKQKRKDRCER